MIDLSGVRIGIITVVSYDGTRGRNRNAWLCKCDCGKEFYALSGNLRSGRVKSCGCIKRNELIKRSTKHGGSGSKLYDVWCAIKARCFNTRNKRYYEYGGRGITMYPAWVHDYSAFRDYILNVIGEKPSEEHSLDRINNDGNYEPGNLRWATVLQQSRNSRNVLDERFNKTLFKKSEERWN